MFNGTELTPHLSVRLILWNSRIFWAHVWFTYSRNSNVSRLNLSGGKVWNYHPIRSWKQSFSSNVKIIARTAIYTRDIGRNLTFELALVIHEHSSSNLNSFGSYSSFLTVWVHTNTWFQNNQLILIDSRWKQVDRSWSNCISDHYRTIVDNINRDQLKKILFNMIISVAMLSNYINQDLSAAQLSVSESWSRIDATIRGRLSKYLILVFQSQVISLSLRSIFIAYFALFTTIPEALFNEAGCK